MGPHIFEESYACIPECLTVYFGWCLEVNQLRQIHSDHFKQLGFASGDFWAILGLSARPYFREGADFFETSCKQIQGRKAG